MGKRGRRMRRLRKEEINIPRKNYGKVVKNRKREGWGK